MIALIQFLIILVVEIIFNKKGVDLKDSTRNKNKKAFKEDEIDTSETKEKTEYEQKIDEVKELTKQIQDESFKAEQLNNPSTFAQHSKMLRKINKMEQQLTDLKTWLNQNQPKEPTKEEKMKMQQEQMREKLDMKDSKGLMRNLRIVCPLLIQLVFRCVLPKVEIVMKENYFYPLGNLFGSYDQDSYVFTLGYILWTIACFRVVSSVQKVLVVK